MFPGSHVLKNNPVYFIGHGAVGSGLRNTTACLKLPDDTEVELGRVQHDRDQWHFHPEESFRRFAESVGVHTSPKTLYRAIQRAGIHYLAARAAEQQIGSAPEPGL